MIELAPRHRPLRILCVEEELVERKLLQACLDAASIEALFANSAAQALWLFRRHPVDMVFIDIDRHASAELSAFLQMRATPGRGERVPMLAVTHNDCGWTEDEYCEAGFAGLFERPVEPTRLFAKIDGILRDNYLPPLLLKSRGDGRMVEHRA